MKIIVDRRFIRQFFRLYAKRFLSERDLDNTRIEVRGNRGHGLRIQIFQDLKPMVELGWWPDYGQSAAWPISAELPFRNALEHRAYHRLTRLVRRLLERQDIIGANGRSMLEVDEAIETILQSIACLGRAIQEQRWTYAREMWAVLSTMDEIKQNPEFANVSAMLARHQWLAEVPTVGIH